MCQALHAHAVLRPMLQGCILHTCSAQTDAAGMPGASSQEQGKGWGVAAPEERGAAPEGLLVDLRLHAGRGREVHRAVIGRESARAPAAEERAPEPAQSTHASLNECKKDSHIYSSRTSGVN